MEELGGQPTNQQINCELHADVDNLELGSRGISVSVMTSFGMHETDSIPGMGIDFSLRHCSNNGSLSYQASYPVVTEGKATVAPVLRERGSIPALPVTVSQRCG